MPTCDVPPKPLYAMVSRADQRALGGSQSTGDEAHQLSVMEDEMFLHWSQRVEILVPAPEKLDDNSYVSVPPNRVSYVKTRYIYMGKGTPLPFELDDE